MIVDEKDMKQLVSLMSDMMDEKLTPINSRLDSIEKRLCTVEERLDSVEESLDTIEENTEITRTATNEIIEWIDKYFRDDYPFPVKKQAI